MSNTTKTTSGSGARGSFLGLLAIVFITLKLCGVIDWSWWWVLAPLWGGVALFLFIAGLALMAALAVKAMERKETPEQRAARKCRELARYYARRG